MKTASYYLHFVPYTDLDLWDVKRYTYDNVFNFESSVRLSEILIPFKRKVKKQEMIENQWNIISKINFGGELFLRNFDELNHYKGNLFLVPENSVIYSKINVRHGCIYHHGENQQPFAVSTEYPVYTFDANKVNGQFLQKLLRTETFKQLLNSKSSGISKARVKSDEFLGIEIPLPSLSEQKKIVAAYQEKIAQAQLLEELSQDLEKEIERYFIKTIGLNNIILKEKTSELSTIDYKDLERWDYFASDINILKELKNSKYPLVKLGEKFDFVNRTFNKREYKKDYFNYIEIGAIDPIKGILSAKEVHLKKAPSRATQFVQEGDLIIGTTRPYLKKFALVLKEYDKNVCSSGFSVIQKSKEYYLPYLLQFLRSSYGVEQLKNRMTGGLYPAINERELKELKVPFPDYDEQVTIMKLVKQKEQEIISNQKKVSLLKKQAEEEFDNTLFH